MSPRPVLNRSTGLVGWWVSPLKFESFAAPCFTVSARPTSAFHGSSTVPCSSRRGSSPCGVAAVAAPRLRDAARYASRRPAGTRPAKMRRFWPNSV